MKLFRIISATVLGIISIANPAFGETCCQKAAAAGKECKDKCCITAHKEGKSCIKCNPNKEDLKLKKTEKKSEKAAKSGKSS
jgi:hypothetical protein